MFNKLFRLPKYISTKLSRKILIPTLLIFSLVLTGFFIFSYLTNDADNKARENENSRQAEQFFNLKLQDLNDFALGLAIQSANNPDIQAAFAAQDREKLMGLTLASYTALKEQYNISQYQFHLSPAISFLRLHSLKKFGDDLSTFRFTVLQVNETQKPVAGLEVGRGGAGIRGVEPVFYQGQHIGSVEFGLNFDKALVNSLKEKYGNDWRIILTRESLSLATLEDLSALKDGPTLDTLVLASTIESVYPNPEIYTKVIGGERLITQVKTAQSKTFSITSLPLRDYSGKIIGVVDIIIDQTELVQAQTNRLIAMILVIIVALVLGAYTVVTTINQSLKPLSILTDAANRIEKGDLSQRVKVTSQDEIGQLGNAFNLMTDQLRNLIASLEQRVTDRTKALATSTEVSRRLSTILNQEELVAEVVDQVNNSFDYYHTQIYFYDEAQENLVMAGGTGEAGQLMLAQFHKVAKGRGLVGRAAETNQAVLVSDTSQNPDWLPNVLLPDTKSEVAIPISIGDEVLGVLDVQHNITDGLQQQDVDTLQSIANQIAVALQNALQYNQAQSALAQSEKLFEASRRLTQAADLQELVKTTVETLNIPVVNRAILGAFSYNAAGELESMTDIANWWNGTGSEVAAIGTSYSAKALELLSVFLSDKPLFFNDTFSDERMGVGGLQIAKGLNIRAGAVLPLLLGTRQLGILMLQAEAPHTFTQDEVRLFSALAPQIATVLENRRQYERAQHQAERETAVNQITQKIQGTTSIEAALQIAARELGHALGMKSTQVTLDPEPLAGKQKGN